MKHIKLVTLNDAGPEARPTITTPSDVMRNWHALLIGCSVFESTREQAFAILLNTRRRLIGVHLIAVGSVDTLLITPSQVFRAAVAANASAIILIHNHPSGDPSPSDGDINVTRTLIKAGSILKVELLDHIVIGTEESTPVSYKSLRELGYFYS